MQKRKSHLKSRNGCTNCKKRHVKCDEGGPPCANCIVRDSKNTCFYSPGARPSPPGDSDSVSTRSASNDQVKLYVRPPIYEPPFPTTRRLLELELMHQWSAQMPKWCLKHDYLMNGLLAIAALEISLVDARHDPFKAEIYLQHALEYYDRGSAEFRAQLDTLNEDNCTELYMFSALAWIISMAIPYDVTYHNEQGILPRTIFLLDLIVGSALIAKESVLWIMKGALASSMQIVIASFMEMGAENWIDEDAENAFEQMKFLNENGPESEVFSRNDYRIAALQLRQCFREEMRGRVKGSALAFPPLGGAPFAASVRNSEPMGLLMLAFWGVMLEKLDRVDKAWWARDVGRSLVEEISSRLLDDRSVIGTMTEFWDCVDWTRRRVGLPAFGSSMEL